MKAGTNRRAETRLGKVELDAARLATSIQRADDMEAALLLAEKALVALLPETVRDRVSLALRDDRADSLCVYRLLPSSASQSTERPRVRMEGTPVGQVVRSGRALLFDAKRNDVVPLGHASRDGIRSTASAPIIIDGTVVGALNIGSSNAGACGPEELELAEESARVIGTPLVRRLRQLQRQRLSLERSGVTGLRDRHQLERIASSDADLLVTGETGVGKTHLARLVHALSPRRSAPMVTVQVGDFASSLVESELFGHEKGAFTGAQGPRMGRFEAANGGTVFLDEVGDIPLELQGKLLRVINDRCFERVGGSKTIHCDLRIIAATNRDLRSAVNRGEFREDLYYRLNVVPLHLSPLRERQADLPQLVESLLAKIGAPAQATLSDEAMDKLAKHDWPGNVRELESVLRRALVLEDGPVYSLWDFEPSLTAPCESRPLDQSWPTLDQCQRRYIEQVLEHCDGVIEGPSGAAQILGLRPSTLRSKMKRLGLSASQSRRKGRSS